MSVCPISLRCHHFLRGLSALERIGEEAIVKNSFSRAKKDLLSEEKNFTRALVSHQGRTDLLLKPLVP